MASNYSNFGTMTSLSIEGRKLYSNEDNQDLEIEHKQNRTISVISEGEIKLGSMTSGKFLSIKQGTISTSYASINTITDGTAILKAGQATGLVSVTSETATISKNIHATSLTDGTSSLTAGTFSGLLTLNSKTLTDGTAIITGAKATGLVSVTSETATISKNIHATSLTDGTSSLTAGTFSGLLHLTSQTITDGTATLKAGEATELVTVNSVAATITNIHVTKLIDTAEATLSGGSITNLKFVDTDIASVTSSAFIEKLTDGGLTMENGSLTGAANTWVSAAVGSFTDLYAHDLFVADDLVLNGSTSVVNSTQVAFEDKLLSLGVSSGRDVTDRTNAVLTLTGDLTSYAANAYVLLMNTSDGVQEIFQISSKNGQEVTLTAVPGSPKFASGTNPGLYVGILGDIANATNAGFEVMGYTGAGTDAAKRVRYIHDATKPAFEFTSENTALDVRVKNTATTVSYYSVNNGSASKRLLTEDALFLDTSSSGTITGSQRTDEKAAIYLSRNADADDAAGDWRMLIDSNGKFTIQKYSGTYGSGGAWNSKWQVA